MLCSFAERKPVLKEKGGMKREWLRKGNER
jgi:hypothetical protein